MTTRAITSTELGTLWMTYQQKTMMIQFLEHFIEHADDMKAHKIMLQFQNDLTTYKGKIEEIFVAEGAAIPVGFTSQDVMKGVPALYDHGFDIMFTRLMNKIAMGLHALHITMVYREDIQQMLNELTMIVQKCFIDCSQYLLEKGLLVKSPYVTMPKKTEFAQTNDYLKGSSLLKAKRSLNTVEVSHIFASIEANHTGMIMITGFSQVAKEKEVKNFFFEGKELAKSVIKEFGEFLQETDIQPPVSGGGIVTKSTESPFSDKLMMYCTSLLSNFSIGSNSIGTAFSLRNDLPTKGAIFIKDIFEYGHKGAKLMIKYGWLEEPPQMEDRRELAK